MLKRLAAGVGISLALFHLAEDLAFADKRKDFKGLFGSYRREKFTENEANDSDWGVDLMISTLYPLSSMASSVGSATAEMPKTISFDLELNFYRTFGYHTMVFFNVGHYSYDTRQENQGAASTGQGGTTGDIGSITQYNNFEASIIPLMLGLKYRFSRTDFVPYLGAAAGVAIYKRSIAYNYSNLEDSRTRMPLSLQGFGGFEFFFAPNSGLRVELGAFMMLAGAETYSTGATAVDSISYPANPLALRYASGVFFLF